MQNDTDCTTLAETTLVPTVAEVFDSKPVETSMQSESVDAVQRESGSPTTRDTPVDCMVVIDKCYSSKGFSKKTRNLLAKSWRKGTQKDYRSKFRQFDSWCREQQVDTYTASLANCADFLTHLFEKGLKYRTINGYRSMLSSVLAPVGNVPVGQHPFIIRLLKGVFNERPPERKLLPEWDLLLVLACLKEEPFEPLKDASLKYLTWKVCFLLAIITLQRCSDLQSLQLGEGYVTVQKRGVTFVRTGIAKQDRPTHHGNTIFIPHLPENKLLDPKRALTHYLKKNQKFSEGQVKRMLSNCF